MFKQYEILSCPFCDTSSIQCVYIPSSINVRKTGGSARGSSVRKSAEEWIIQSGCSKCGKSMEEVEKELRKKGAI